MKKHKEEMLYENLEKMRGAAYRYEATTGRCYETAKKTGLLCMKMHIIIAGNLYDSFYAWQFGPVVPEVYREYCVYGGRPINIRCQTSILGNDVEQLNDIIDQYVDIPVNILVEKTHTPGKPWDRTYKSGLGNRQAIPFYLIEDLECGG